MKPFAKLFVANFKEFTRERLALFWTFAFPVLFILLFGAIFSGGETGTYQIGVALEDQSPIAQGFMEALKYVPIFEVKEGSREDELQALKDGKRRLVIVVGADFGQLVTSGRQGSIDVYHDPSQTTVAQVLLPIVRKVASEFERNVAGTPTLVQLNERAIQARHFRFIDFFVPGILAMTLMQLGLFAGLPLVIQRQNHILKRLGATPLPRWTIIASSVAFRLVLSLVQALLIIIIGRLVFGVQMEGNWLFLIGMVLLGAATFVSLGFLVASFTRTQETAVPLFMVIQFPMMFLGGVFFPVESMPAFLKPVVQAIPLTYLGDSLRQIMVDSSPLHSHLVNIVVLGGWLVVCLILSVRFFRWE
jgi:ABC-2 type transport system permease protein